MDAEETIEKLCSDLSVAKITHLPETRGTNYGYSVNLFFSEKDFWRSMAVADLLWGFKKHGELLSREDLPEERITREMRESILKREAAARKQSKRGTKR